MNFFRAHQANRITAIQTIDPFGPGQAVQRLDSPEHASTSAVFIDYLIEGGTR